MATVDLARFDLGEAGVEWLRRNLALGKAFSRAVLDLTDLTTGRCWADLPRATPLDAVERFDRAIFPLTPLPKELQAGSRGLLVPKETVSRKVLAETVAGFSASPGRIFLVEDMMWERKDGLRATHGTNAWTTTGGTLLLGAVSPVGADVIERSLAGAANAWMETCAVCSVARHPPSIDGGELAEATLSELVANPVLIGTTAWDGEGMVFWERE